MKKHKHLFIHIGGGCRLGSAIDPHTDRNCDDEYKCRCGKKEQIYTTLKEHFKMSKRMGERKLKTHV